MCKYCHCCVFYLIVFALKIKWSSEIHRSICLWHVNACVMLLVLSSVSCSCSPSHNLQWFESKLLTFCILLKIYVSLYIWVYSAEFATGTNSIYKWMFQWAVLCVATCMIAWALCAFKVLSEACQHDLRAQVCMNQLHRSVKHAPAPRVKQKADMLCTSWAKKHEVIVVRWHFTAWCKSYPAPCDTSRGAHITSAKINR